MSELLNSTTALTANEAGYKEVGMIESGVEKSVLLKAGDLPAGEGSDLNGYVKTADLTGASAATATDGLKLLLVDGSTVKQLTLAQLKSYLA